MAFDRPTLTEIIERITSDFETRITGATTLLRRAVLKIVSKVFGGAVHLLYDFLNYISDQLFASSADDENLEAIGDEFGVVRNAATKATGTAEASGVNGTVIPTGTEIQSLTGVIYETIADATIALGVADIDFEAQEAGANGNNDGGITLTLTSPIAGLNSDVTVDSDGISGGADEEVDDSYRERILARKRLPPHGGAEFDYETWAKEVSGVTRAWSIPLYQGDGTIALTFVRDDDASIIPNATQRDTVKNYIIEHDDPATGTTVGIPVTAEPGFFVPALSLLTVNFEIDISPNTADIQTAIEDELEDFILREGGPEQTLRVSRMNEAISLGNPDGFHVLQSPSADVTATSVQVHVIGIVTFNTL